MRPSRTVTISLSPELAREVDRAANAEGRTRSEMFREALRQYLARRGRWEQIFAYGEQAARHAGVTEDDVLDAVRDRRRSRAATARRRK